MALYKSKPPRGPVISDRFVITIRNLATKEETRSAVLARMGDMIVTEEMVKEQVAILNRNCIRHGLTGQKMGPQTVFGLLVL